MEINGYEREGRETEIASVMRASKRAIWLVLCIFAKRSIDIEEYVFGERERERERGCYFLINNWHDLPGKLLITTLMIPTKFRLARASFFNLIFNFFVFNNFFLIN